MQFISCLITKYLFHQVFVYDFPTDKWAVLGKIKQGRADFGMTGINANDIACATGEARIQARIVTGGTRSDNNEVDINLEMIARAKAEPGGE